MPIPVVLVCSAAFHLLLGSVLLQAGHGPLLIGAPVPIEFALLEKGGAGSGPMPAPPAPMLGEGGTADRTGALREPATRTKMRPKPVAHRFVQKSPDVDAFASLSTVPSAAQAQPADTAAGTTGQNGSSGRLSGQSDGHANGDASGVTGGAAGGVAGGVTGGVAGGTGSGAGVGEGGGGGSKFVAPSVAMGQRVHSPDPPYTVAAESAGVEGTVTAKVCVNDRGQVSNVQIMRHMPMGMDGSVVETVKRWQFRPFLFNGRAVPFCYVHNFVYRLR